MPVVPYVRATHSDGQSWSAAKANLLEAGVNDVSYAPAVRVTHNTTQAITTATDTAVAFNTERIDQAGNAADTMHDTATNNSRLTCRYAGVYFIQGQVVYTADPGTGHAAIRWSNGSVALARAGVVNINLIGWTINVSTVYPLAVNEYVELVVRQDSGSNKTITNLANYSPEFMMVRIG